MNFNPFEMIKGFQNIQSKMNEAQERLRRLRVTGSSGGGMVTVELDGEFTVIKVTISPSVVDSEDIDMLQDLMQAAIMDGISKAKEKQREEIVSATGLNIPPGLLGLQ
jgi:DNA-binding YbaB/EbfC family protein